MNKNYLADTIIPVVLAGGSGSRLWPLSRSDRPKQFQRLSGDVSLFQDTVGRLRHLENCSQPIIVTSQQHRHLVEQQLAEIGVRPRAVIVEPVGRNTAPAITLAALTEARRDGHAHRLLVLPSDHRIGAPEELVQAVNSAAQFTERAGLLVAFGIAPSRPETGYGYIQRGARLADSNAFRIDRFVEKPRHDAAEEMVASGEYCWNSGMFLFPVSTFLEEMTWRNPGLVAQCRAALGSGSRDGCVIEPNSRLFGEVEDISVDYALMERTDRAAVFVTDPDWNDLGSWASIWEVADKDASGNAVVGKAAVQSARNSYVRSDGIFTAVVGVDDVVVVTSEDAILVTSRGKAEHVKTLVNNLKQFGHRGIDGGTVYRPWGSYRTIDRGEGFHTKRITVAPGGQLSLQFHNHRSEHWTVVSGTARVTVGNEIRHMGANESVYIPLGAVHRLENLGDEPMVLIEVQCGHYLEEDDIVRLVDTYGRAEAVEAFAQAA